MNTMISKCPPMLAMKVIHVRPLEHVHVDDLALNLDLHRFAMPRSTAATMAENAHNGNEA